MKSGGGGGSGPSNDPTPNIHAVADENGVTPFGQATRFNPQYTSFLPGNGQVAQLNDPSRQEFGQNTALLAQQDANIAAQTEAAKTAAAQPQGQSDRDKLVMLLLGGKNRYHYGGDNHAGRNN
jgi:hypothetical protein